ncbi:MAG: dihydrodipicolinate synthase family protein, partial [Oscillospiraceae bacterium]|nr:dihydrodipicolinate synthase family protein [Oscillospiraceae bacterium]
ILYNIPGRTGLNISVETAEKLAHHKNIVAMKEASGNISYTAQIMATCGDFIDVYSGNDDMIVPIMSLGGKGVISVLSNILPKETHEIAQLCLDNNFQKAGELQLKYLELINSLFCEVNPIPVKEAMNRLGMPAGDCRMPLTKMSADNVARLLSAMQNVGLPVSVVD